MEPAGKPTAVADAFVPIVLCRLEPDAPKSEEIWTQRFSADGRLRNNHPVQQQGKGETREGLWG